MTTQDQNPKKRTQDDLATTHGSMLRVLQSKTLPPNTRAKKIVTTIHANSQVYTLESYRDKNDHIGHGITEAPEDADKPQSPNQTVARAGA